MHARNDTATFHLNEDAARSWLTRPSSEVFELGRLSTSTNGSLDTDWDPRLWDHQAEEITTLIDEAQQTQVGVISTNTPGSAIEFLYAFDEDGGGYVIRVMIPPPGVGPDDFEVSSATGLRLSTLWSHARKVGVPNARGVNQAVAILQEVVAEANALLDQLQRYMAALPAPRIEILHTRTADESCDLHVYLNGQAHTDHAYNDVDAGAGYTASDLEDIIALTKPDQTLTPAYRDALIRAYTDALDSPYTQQ